MYIAGEEGWCGWTLKKYIHKINAEMRERKRAGKNNEKLTWKLFIFFIFAIKEERKKERKVFKANRDDYWFS